MDRCCCRPSQSPALKTRYPPKTAVDAISFEIRRGEIFGLLGPNGAGKTSTLSAIEGLVRPQSGSILLDSIDIRRHPTQARARMGVQLQATSFQSELKIREIVRLCFVGAARAGPRPCCPGRSLGYGISQTRTSAGNAARRSVNGRARCSTPS